MVICRILEYENEDDIQFDSKSITVGIYTVFCQSVSI